MIQKERWSTAFYNCELLQKLYVPFKEIILFRDLCIQQAKELSHFFS